MGRWRTKKKKKKTAYRIMLVASAGCVANSPPMYFCYSSGASSPHVCIWCRTLITKVELAHKNQRRGENHRKAFANYAQHLPIEKVLLPSHAIDYRKKKVNYSLTLGRPCLLSISAEDASVPCTRQLRRKIMERAEIETTHATKSKTR